MVGETEPPSSEYDARCRYCFREQMSAPTTDLSGSGSDSCGSVAWCFRVFENGISLDVEAKPSGVTLACLVKFQKAIQ